jgi:hypothetical protein
MLPTLVPDAQSQLAREHALNIANGRFTDIIDAAATIPNLSIRAFAQHSGMTPLQASQQVDNHIRGPFPNGNMHNSYNAGNQAAGYVHQPERPQPIDLNGYDWDVLLDEAMPPSRNVGFQPMVYTEQDAIAAFLAHAPIAVPESPEEFDPFMLHEEPVYLPMFATNEWSSAVQMASETQAFGTYNEPSTDGVSLYADIPSVDLGFGSE